METKSYKTDTIVQAWQDTVMHLDDIDEGRYPDSFASLRKALEKQAEISFKAGQDSNVEIIRDTYNKAYEKGKKIGIKGK